MAQTVHQHRYHEELDSMNRERYICTRNVISLPKYPRDLEFVCCVFLSYCLSRWWVQLRIVRPASSLVCDYGGRCIMLSPPRDPEKQNEPCSADQSLYYKMNHPCLQLPPLSSPPHYHSLSFSLPTPLRISLFFSFRFALVPAALCNLVFLIRQSPLFLFTSYSFTLPIVPVLSILISNFPVLSVILGMYAR